MTSKGITRQLKQIAPFPVKRFVRVQILDRWTGYQKDVAQAAWMRQHFPELYQRIHTADLPTLLRHRLIDYLRRESEQGESAGSFRAVEADVLFVGQGTRIDDLKDIIALKKYDPRLRIAYVYKGAGTYLDLYRQYCSPIIEYKTAADLVRIMERVTARVVILSSKASRDDLLLARVAWSGRTIYRAREFAMRAPRELIKESQYLAEKYQLEHADGVFHIYADGAMDILKREHTIPCPALSVRPYCVPELGPHRKLPKFSAADGRLHVVYIASVAAQTRDARVAGQAMHLDTWAKIVEQGIHLHVYDAHNVLVTREPGYEGYIELAARSPYFHIERFVPYPILLEQLTQYDWGMPYFDLKGGITLREGFYTAIGNNYYTYFQAGLPVITSPTSEDMAKIATQYGVGIAVTSDDIPHLAEILRAQDMSQLIANVQHHATVGGLTFPVDALGNLVLGDTRR
ncbi:MAG: hypothetical protein IT324_07350 [Anaerolineae bacterium]|nr:hypothetical protein [Anaerolineae bacterium]